MKQAMEPEKKPLGLCGSSVASGMMEKKMETTIVY